MFRIGKVNALIMIFSAITISLTLVLIFTRFSSFVQNRRVRTQKFEREQVSKVKITASKIDKGANDLRRPQSKTEKELSKRQRKQIHNYMEDIWDKYESIYSDDQAESLVLIEASKEFEKSIIAIFRTYTIVQNEKAGLNLSENELDVLGIARLKTLGFKEIRDKWYYNGMIVNVGSPLPIPKSMKPQPADRDSGFIVSLEVATAISELNHVKFMGETNLPNNMKLMLRVESPDERYLAQDKVNVENGEFTSDWFSDADRPSNGLASGNYTLVITSPTVNVQVSSVKSVLGEQGKNMKGPYIRFDPIWGNTIEFKNKFYVK